MQAHVTCPSTAAVFACHLAPWGYQSDDQSRYMMVRGDGTLNATTYQAPLPRLATSQWNLNFALLPLISQWEFTHNRTAAIAALPLIAAATDWWACYLTKVSANGSYFYHDNNTFLPDNEHENQADADPQVG